MPSPRTPVASAALDKRYLADLLPFIESARAGSFSAASRVLQQTPSAVSKSIARLERAFDTRLFVRNTHQLRLTAEGQVFLTQVEKALGSLDDAAQALVDAHDEATGVVRVSVLAAFGRHFVLPLVRPLLARHPGIDVELQFDDGTRDLVVDRFDLAVRAGPLRAQNSVVSRIATLPLVLVASPSYLRDRGIPRSPRELAAHDCVSIRLPSGKPARWVFAQEPDGAPSWHQPQGRLVLSEQPADVLVDAAVGGLGVTAIAACMVVDQLRSGQLKLLLPTYRMKSDADIFIQYPNRGHLPARVRAVTDFLLEALRADKRIATRRADLLRYAADKAARS